MKRLMMAVLVLLAAGSAKAQVEGRWSVVPHAGLNISRLGGDDVPNYCGSITGFTGGLEAEYRFSQVLGVSVGVDFSMMGCSTDETVEVIEEHADFKYRMQAHTDRMRLRYLTIPVQLNLHVWKGLTFRAGVQAGWLEGARLKGSTVSVYSPWELGTHFSPLTEDDGISRLTIYEGKRPAPLTADGIDNPIWENEDLNEGIRSQCNDVDFAIPVEVTYEYKNFLLGVGYQLGLSNIFREDDCAYNRNLSFRVGYRINL